MGSGATKAEASGGSSTVWSSGLCRPDTSLASMRLLEMPAEHLNPTSACACNRRLHLCVICETYVHLVFGSLMCRVLTCPSIL